jgi:cytochrome c
MRSPSVRVALLLPAFLALAANTALAQSPTFGLGRSASADEVRAWDISIHPVTGAELPPGRGTATEGALVYRRQCPRCPGADGTEGRAPRLV